MPRGDSPDSPADTEAAVLSEPLEKMGKLGVTVPVAASVTPASLQRPGCGGDSQQGSGSP